MCGHGAGTSTIAGLTTCTGLETARADQIGRVLGTTIILRWIGWGGSVTRPRWSKHKGAGGGIGVSVFYIRLLAILTAGLGIGLMGRLAQGQVDLTLTNFFLPGTQPDQSSGVDFVPILHADNCRVCHEIDVPYEVPIYTRWASSMKANAARDPLFRACLTIANQDAAFVGDVCLRCHTPGGWLAGRSVPTDGSELIEVDLDGVTCHMCHRMVDPVFKPGVSPSVDESILDALQKAGVLPIQAGNAGYVVDRRDVRRGPFDDVPFNLHGDNIDIIYSPFHKTSEVCATCHDVSNPVFTRQPDGSYALNPADAEHPTMDKHDMFPLERTYSEWLNSAYANGGVDAGGIFGGNHPTGIMVTCQDCHMPDMQAYGCGITSDPFFERPNVPSHDFNGGNTWLQDAIDNLYDGVAYPWYFDASQERARYMLKNASSLSVTQEACGIRVRVTNETGHKLPTGYPEGRRLWINVEFYDQGLKPVAERGGYDDPTAELTTADTKVYEVKLGVDAAVSAATGIPQGPSFHFALNNKYYKDNRIPPRGFTNAAFEAVQAAPVAHEYADGQYWDETAYRIPPGATRAVVRLFYQTASREYIEFLRDENDTDDTGGVMYDQWVLLGKSPPELMREKTVVGLTPGAVADADCDDDVDLFDYQWLPDCQLGPGRRVELGCEVFDADLDGGVGLLDVAEFQRRYEVAP